MHIIHNKRYKNYNFPQAKWLQYVVIDGDGRIDIMNKIKKGDCFISSANKTKFSLIGNLTLAISYIRK
jgi:hypothetical protein